MHFLRSVGSQPDIAVHHTVTGYWMFAQRHIARRDQCNQRGGGGAGCQYAAGPGRKSEQLPHPGYYLALHFQRNLIAPAYVGVQPGSQHLGQHADRRAAAMHPAHKTRMPIAHCVGQDVLHKLIVQIRQFSAIGRQSAQKELPYRFIGRLPDRPLTNLLQRIEHIIQHAMALGTKIVPVSRIKHASCRSSWPDTATSAFRKQCI